MANEVPGNGSKVIYILLIGSLGLGSFNTVNSTDNEDRITKLIDGLDIVLQREMRLLTQPLFDRVFELGDDQDNMRDRMNMLENLVHSNKAYIETLERDVERLKSQP